MRISTHGRDKLTNHPSLKARSAKLISKHNYILMNKLQSLKEKLNLNKNWPQVYMFKFIVPAEMEKIARVEALFSQHATIYRKESKTGKFISITAKQKMDNSDQIIGIYQKAYHIEQIVAL
jgi:hypothetical protein